ncbi:MAG TPA: VOC family protein [Hydrogenophaga sp.]|uniref:VOC family protein n=1 Tax=Hydrogenophaga sp. TaxID=1904254 RepID=UPI002CC9B9A3|nr:VOC family protein [Hydrogenophaga sp.]HSX94361.1 VOC family protein [Hydrogenophaga sp.]
MNAAFDHLVVAAATLAEGVHWCETTLGRTPAPGGAHALFGTHNRLLRLDGAERTYLELLAINPAAKPTRAPPLKRWFDLDEPAMLERLRAKGPQPIHWVARVDDIEAARAAWLAQGIDPGPVLTASRETPRGLLQWRITVRDDGARGFDGVLPTLIQWGGIHPVATLPDSGLQLRGLRLAHPRAAALNTALDAIGLRLPVHKGEALISAHLHDGQQDLNLLAKT